MARPRSSLARGAFARRRLGTIALMLLTAGCVDRLTDGLLCVSDRDCPGARCDLTASVCQSSEVPDKHSPDGAVPAPEPDIGGPSAPEIAAPRTCDDYREGLTRPQIIVMSSEARIGRVGQFVEAALDAMGEHAPPTLHCPDTARVALELALEGTSGVFLIGPLREEAAVHEAYPAFADRLGAVRIAPDPSLARENGWSTRPDPALAAREAARLLRAWAIEGPRRRVVSLSPGGSPGIDAFEAALCGPDPHCGVDFAHLDIARLGEHIAEARQGAGPLPDADLVVLDSAVPHHGALLPCALDAAAGEDGPPPALVVGHLVDARHFTRPDRSPCMVEHPTARCRIRGLSATHLGAVRLMGVDPPPMLGESAREVDGEVRMHDALLLAGLAASALDWSAAPDRGALDAAMGAMLTAADAPPLALDAAGWSDARERLLRGEPLPPLLGSISDSAPDAQTRSPALTRLSLRRFTLDGEALVLADDVTFLEGGEVAERGRLVELLFEAGCP